MVDLFTLFLAVIGGVACLLALVMIGYSAVSAFLGLLDDYNRQRYFSRGSDFVRNRFLADAWWFSESPETCALIADLASGMDVSTARDKWRMAREEQSTEAAK